MLALFAHLLKAEQTRKSNLLLKRSAREILARPPLLSSSVMMKITLLLARRRHLRLNRRLSLHVLLMSPQLKAVADLLLL